MNDSLFGCLQEIASSMNRVSEKKADAPVYDMMSDSLVWLDEFPLPTDVAPRKATVLRFLHRYRSSVITGVLDPRNDALSGLWEAGKNLFPGWVGFHPERCNSTPHLSKQFDDLKHMAKHSR